MEKLVFEKGYKNESELIRACCLLKEIDENEESDNSKTNDRLFIRVTEEEKKQIREDAKKAGINLSRYVRNCCLGKSKNLVVITDLKDFARELNKIGVNLNQITRLANEGLIQSADAFEAKEELKKIYKELTKLNKKTQPRR